MSSPSPYPKLRVSATALANNLKLVHDLVGPETRVLVPVKANAYGCGLDTLIPFFLDADINMLGVANPGEAEELRKLNWGKPILNLGGFFAENVDRIFELHLTPSITDVWQIDLLERRCNHHNRDLGVHIKFDLGMGRIGIKQEQVNAVVEKIRQCKRLKIEGLYTHFPCADDDDRTATQDQLTNFLSLTGSLLAQWQLDRDKVCLHSANSYATMLHENTRLDMVRPGIMFYGYFQTFADRARLRERFQLTPSMKLDAKPVSVRTMRRGESVSYGSTYTIEAEEMPVGVFPLGYADGVPRLLANKIAFGKHALLGNVTMDQIMLGDVSNPDQAVDLLGEGTEPLEKWADLCKTTSYEIMTGLGSRLRRELVD